jgi:UDP-3-O-[3-hydroxymyristoyl] N-acetylglucosamine deacetylase
MNDANIGLVVVGHTDDARKAYAQWAMQPLDWDLTPETEPDAPWCARQRTISRSVTVQGPGTFLGKQVRTVTFSPMDDREGWWFDRPDLEDALPFQVSARNVWTTGDIVSNIVLRAGPPHNYIRMVEHIIALKLGMRLDGLLIQMDSGDPPLFSRGSLDLVEAIESAGVRELERPVRYVTVAEPVTGVSSHGGFVTLLPCETPKATLHIDCAIDFKTAIGRQRIRFYVTPKVFRYGAEARTNTTAAKMLYCRTIGRVFADIRHLGYTMENIVVAGRRRYYNEPRLLHDGKSLEAVWHRAALDLLAALALIEDGVFVGRVVSYKAGHGLDVSLVRQLYRRRLLVPFVPR